LSLDTQEEFGVLQCAYRNGMLDEVSGESIVKGRKGFIELETMDQ